MDFSHLHRLFPFLLQLAVDVIEFPAADAMPVAVFARFAQTVVLDIARFEGACLAPVDKGRSLPIVITIVAHQPALLAVQAAILVGSFVNQFTVVGVVFAVQPVGTVALHVIFLGAGTCFAAETYLQPFLTPGTVGGNIERIAAFGYFCPDAVLLSVGIVARDARLAESVHLGILAVLHPLLIIVRGLVILVRALYERILLAHLTAVTVVVLAAQGAVVVVVKFLAVLTAVLVIHLALQLARGVEGTVHAMQLTVLVGFLFLHPTLAVVELEGAFLATVTVGAFAPQLIVFVLGILAVIETVLELRLDVGRMIAVDNASVAVERLVGLQVAIEEAPVAHVDD